MNALYISYDGLTEPLGRSQILPYLKALSKKGIFFTILTFEKQPDFKNIHQITRIKTEILNQFNIKWISLKYHRSPSLFATAYDVLRGMLKASYIVLKRKITIVHRRSYVSMLIALPICSLSKKKIIFDMRGLWPDEKVEGGIWKEKGILYKIAKYFEKKFILNSDQIIVLTSKMKRLIEEFEYTKDKKINIYVIPTCVDLKKFHLKNQKRLSKESDIPNKDFVFVYAGSIGTVYMIEEVIKFFNVAFTVLDNSHLLILTHGNKEIIYKEANRFNLNNHITIKKVEYDDLPFWLSFGKVAIAFYKSSYSVYGRSPTKIGEYLACGLPIVVNSGVGDLDDIIEKERVGIILKSFSEKSFHQSILELKKLLKEKESLKTRCYLFAKKYFSLKSGVEEYAKIYQWLYYS